jgi:phenylalanine-4-hydroxylase
MVMMINSSVSERKTYAKRSSRGTEHLKDYIVQGDFRAEEHAAWNQYVERHILFCDEMKDRIVPEYFGGMFMMDIDSSRIPSLEQLNRPLAPLGWTAVWVDGYLSPKVYAGFLARRIFPIGRNMRSPELLDYSPIPDLIHDIFGHLPMLFVAECRHYMERAAQAMLMATESPLDHEYYAANRALGNLCSQGCSAEELRAAEAKVQQIHQQLMLSPSEVTHLSRIFLWSLEFGLIGTQNDFQIMGAGLLSSHREGQFVYSGSAELHNYSLDVIRHDIQFADVQTRYFIAPSCDRMVEVLDAYRRQMTLGLPRYHQSA